MTALTRPVYTACATADAGRDGTVRSDDGVLDLALGRVPGLGGGDDDPPGTNPEQLFAAGYAACFHAALLANARKRRIPAEGSSVTAAVTIGTVPGGGYGLAVKLTVTLPSTGQEDAERVVDLAHAACPYSRATRGNVEVTVVVRATG